LKVGEVSIRSLGNLFSAVLGVWGGHIAEFGGEFVSQISHNNPVGGFCGGGKKGEGKSCMGGNFSISLFHSDWRQRVYEQGAQGGKKKKLVRDISFRFLRTLQHGKKGRGSWILRKRGTRKSEGENVSL